MDLTELPFTLRGAGVPWFSWGTRPVAITGVAPAGPARWSAILPTLRAACPDWTFRVGGD
jgi:hypothetical protein